MQVTIDPDAGFCFGVEEAIRIAETELDQQKGLYCLGEMVHNKAELDRLKNKGLDVVGRHDISHLKGKRVLFRAHGEPPETYELAESSGVTIIDATCPIVLKLQRKIRSTVEAHGNEPFQLVIFGKRGHPEVEGLLGHSSGKAIVVQDETDLEKLDYTLPTYLFSQTTMSSGEYEKISGSIRERMMACHNDELFVSKSFCRQVSGRSVSIKKFAASHDVIIFASDRNSSNGAFLYQVCSAENPRSHFVHDASEINVQWLKDAETVGITGATSTPAWLMEEIAREIRLAVQH